MPRRGSSTCLCGRNTIDAAQRAGEDLVECVVKQGVSPEEREEFRLADEYFSSLLPPIKMAESFIHYREKYHVTQQELARRTGITAGTVHHYESLRKTLSPKLQTFVDRGKLTFKEARCIADIDGYQRQEELAQPFIDAKLSSVHVEELVAKAKSDSSIDSAALIAEFVGEEPTSEKPKLEIVEDETTAKRSGAGSRAKNQRGLRRLGSDAKGRVPFGRQLGEIDQRPKSQNTVGSVW